MLLYRNHKYFCLPENQKDYEQSELDCLDFDYKKNGAFKNLDHHIDLNSNLDQLILEGIQPKTTTP